MVNLRTRTFHFAHKPSIDYHQFRRPRKQRLHIEARLILREHIDLELNPEHMIILEEHVKKLREALARRTPKQCHCLLLGVSGLCFREIIVPVGVSDQRVGEIMQGAIPRFTVRTQRVSREFREPGGSSAVLSSRK